MKIEVPNWVEASARSATVIMAKPGDDIYNLKALAEAHGYRFIYHNGRLYELITTNVRQWV